MAAFGQDPTFASVTYVLCRAIEGFAQTRNSGADIFSV